MSHRHRHRGEGMFMFIVWEFLIRCWLGLYCASKHYTILFCLNWTTETMQTRCCCQLSAVYVVYHQWGCCYSKSRASVPQLKTGSRLVAVFTCVSYAEARNSCRLDVCLSVRPSVTRWYYIKTAEHIVMLSSPHDSPFILVLCVPRSSRNSDGVTPAGALNTGGV